jgi:hypothetical protein
MKKILLLVLIVSVFFILGCTAIDGAEKCKKDGKYDPECIDQLAVTNKDVNLCDKLNASDKSDCQVYYAYIAFRPKSTW